MASNMAKGAGIIILLMLVYAALFTSALQPVGNKICAIHPDWCGGTTPPPGGSSSTTSVMPGARVAKMSLGIQDYFNGTSLTTGHVDVVPINNLAQAYESALAITTYPTTSGQRYTEGLQYYVNVYNPNSYPRVYRITVGGAVEEMIPNVPVGTDGTGAPSFTFNTIGTMTLSTEATPVWVVPAFRLKAVASAASILLQLQGPSGNIRQVTANGAGANEVAAGSQTVNYTAGAKTFQLDFVIKLSQVSRSYGEPVVTLSSTAPYAFQVRYLVLWLDFNSTQLGTSSMAGFYPITVQPTGHYVSYTVLSPVTSAQSTTGSTDIPIPIDTSSVTSSTKLMVRVWIGSYQYGVDVHNGSKDAAPTAYGAFSGYGSNSIIPAQQYTTSSNLPASSELSGYITTY